MAKEKNKVRFAYQIGFMLSIGVNYENRLYLCVDLPFVWMQIFIKQLKNRKWLDRL